MKKILTVTLAVLLFAAYNTISDPNQTGSSTSAQREQPIHENKSSTSSDEPKIGNVKLTLIKTYTGFKSPTGIALDDKENLYVTNWSGGTITKIDTNGNASTFADNVGSPSGLAFGPDGNLYASGFSQDEIYRITPEGEESVFVTGMHTPAGLSFNRAGELLVNNRTSNEILKINISTGTSKVAAQGLNTPVATVEDSDGNLYICNFGGGIVRASPNGTLENITDEFGRPGVGIAFDQQGRLFATDNADDCVRLINLDGSTEIVADGIGGCVALFIHENIMYVSSWSDGAIYIYSIT